MEEQYTYVFPKNFQQKFIHFLEQNNLSNLSKLLYNCKIDYTDINLAYYAGMKGSVWNKRALDFTIEAPEKTISEVKSYYSVLKAWLQNFLKPNETGFLVRYINYIIREDEINIELPENSDDDLQILNRDIAESIAESAATLIKSFMPFSDAIALLFPASDSSTLSSTYSLTCFLFFRFKYMVPFSIR